ncbi:MAG TPA: exonuclease SbcCD subunit D [Promineifilum sp.]|nr:exonuclease SbcCD subunit D [Promineifilum sp.]HRO90387.1 exonuclease SbcCD subunit D [Promineifilum sp.]HRQ12700.1 exonuclease SbcCD subunit D [Promineifilum sp.]
MAVKILHFADAHIDIANYGRHDPETGLPYRVVDFLKSLDSIIDAAIAERVDLVIFAGDAYKDRNPQPTFQRAWGERMMRLSRAGIATILLIGNHDIAPADYRAHTLQEFATLAVPHVFVADKLMVFGPEQLGVPVQVLALPWVTRSRFLARNEMSGKTTDEIHTAIVDRIRDGLDKTIANEIDPNLPLIFTAHASIGGATFGSERMVMLGQDLILSKGLVANPRFDYVALGHIHKHQSLNEQPPVVYSGSIERIDFGEWREPKGFVLAEVERGKPTSWRFVELETRPFYDKLIRLEEADGFMDQLMSKLPAQEQIEGAICRLRLEYPHELDALLDEKLIYEHFAGAFDLRIVKNRTGGNTSRISRLIAVESLGPYELLRLYWGSKNHNDGEVNELLTLAEEVLGIHAPTAGALAELNLDDISQ